MNKLITLNRMFTIVTAIAALIVAIALYWQVTAQPVKASVFPGQIATMATTSNPTITSTVGPTIAATSSCAARIITTVGSPIMLTFNDRVPTALFGHLQAASTTVSYDGGIYGCGSVRAYSFTSAAITISETFGF